MESLEELTIQERITRTEATLRFAQEQAAQDRLAYQNAENRYRRSERRFRILCGVLLGAIVITTILPFVSPVAAQGYSVTLTSLAARVVALETKTANMSVLTDPNTEQPTVRFSNVNVQVVSGDGESVGLPNGRGNLIIGYNGLRPGSSPEIDRRGSHNLVMGTGNNYPINTIHGVVNGTYCTIRGDGAMVLGGFTNSAESQGAVVVSGSNNRSIGINSVILGGYLNEARGFYSCVTAGQENSASGSFASVSAGHSNTASNGFSSVSGGESNLASGVLASVTGGFGNEARGVYSSVSGGNGNPATGFYSSVSGGFANTASGESSSISGGSGTVASSTYQWVGGGYHTP